MHLASCIHLGTTLNYLFAVSAYHSMLHFLIFKTSLDSLGLPNVQSRARGEGAQKLTLRRLVALNSSKQRNYCAALQDSLLNCCLFYVEQLWNNFAT